MRMAARNGINRAHGAVARNCLSFCSEYGNPMRLSAGLRRRRRGHMIPSSPVIMGAKMRGSDERNEALFSYVNLSRVSKSGLAGFGRKLCENKRL
jgi:hypothetical protein